jgi:hypothetical protein
LANVTTSRAALLALLLAISLACQGAPVPTQIGSPSAAPPFTPAPSPTQAATRPVSPSPSPTTTPLPATPGAQPVTIVLGELNGSGLEGTLSASEDGLGNTLLQVALSETTALLPWSLHPGFQCDGAPAEDSQLPIGLPDIENGAAQEVVSSINFGEPLGVVVFELGAGSALPVACGILPALDWSVVVTPTAPTHDPLAPAAIIELVESMETRIRERDADAYMAVVDTRDPVFSVEHERWARDWEANPVDELELSVSDVLTSNSEATGLLAIRWSAGGHPPREAQLPVRFTFSSADSTWSYAGERWVTEEVDHFRVRVAPGLESEIPAITGALPETYEHVTSSIDHEPAGTMEIKLYAGAPELVATVQLRVPDIHGWNEPGEALKMRLDPEVPSLTLTIAHEFTHFVEFDRAGTRRSRMPWWLSEGLASLVAYGLAEPEAGDLQLERVRRWAATDELVEWTDMSVFETTPQSLWQYVYAQGYAMARYVTEEYGEAARNELLAAMAVEMDIEEATDAHLGTSFEQLSDGFEDWLSE